MYLRVDEEGDWGMHGFSVFLVYLSNKKPYVSLLGGSFFVALESGCLAYESGFIIIELMDAALRLM